MADWQQWADKLGTVGETGIDDVVDELSSLLLASPPDSEATATAVKALERAKSDLSVVSAALALAYVVAIDDDEPVEKLEQVYEARRQHIYLAPALLSALTLLGLRSDSARAGAVRYLQRLKPTEPRPMLVAGIRGIGLLCDRGNNEQLRAKLFSFARSDDVAVKAEARQQIALLRLADALLAESHSGLIASLSAAKEAFRTAESSEELRPDAKLFRMLLDAVLLFDELDRDRDGVVERIKGIAADLREMSGRNAEHIFRMDRSPAASQIAHRCSLVASSIEAAAGGVANLARWTNFNQSVVRLAECYGEVRCNVTWMPGYEQAGATLIGFADRVMKPRLGPVLARKVGWEGFEEVIRNYEADKPIPDVLAGLRELQLAALEAERKGSSLSEKSVGTLLAMAEKVGITPDELIGRFNIQIETNSGGELVVAAKIQQPPPNLRGKKMPLPTIGIIVALPEEYDAVRVMIDNEQKYRADGAGGARDYLLGDIPSIRQGVHQVVLAQTSDMGNTSAALRAAKMLMDFDGIDHIIMCGIAGGVPHPLEPEEHVRLGDIVVSNRKGVIQYDFGKQRGEVFEERSAPRPPSARLSEAVKMLEQDKLSGQRPWDSLLQMGLATRQLSHPDLATDVLLDAKGDKVEHPAVAEARPRVFLGPIASANVVQGDFKKRDLLRDQHKVKAVEMEARLRRDRVWLVE